jgi:hypothetical protein
VQRSRTARIVLIVGGLFVGLFGWMIWADEAEHGGWEAVEGLEEGYLADGSVEVREVPWSNRGEDLGGSYEVRVVEGGTYEVAYVDREGVVLFTGTLGETQAWLDDQGDQMFVGTRAEATAWIDEQRDTEKDYVVPAVVIAVGALLVIAGLLPNRRATERQPDLTAPPAPAL